MSMKISLQVAVDRWAFVHSTGEGSIQAASSLASKENQSQIERLQKEASQAGKLFSSLTWFLRE